MRIMDMDSSDKILVVFSTFNFLISSRSLTCDTFFYDIQAATIDFTLGHLNLI